MIFSKNYDFPSVFHIFASPPHSPPRPHEPPRGPQEAPKRPPRRPQDGPSMPSRCARPPQEALRGLQDWFLVDFWSMLRWFFIILWSYFSCILAKTLYEYQQALQMRHYTIRSAGPGRWGIYETSGVAWNIFKNPWSTHMAPGIFSRTFKAPVVNPSADLFVIEN